MILFQDEGGEVLHPFDDPEEDTLDTKIRKYFCDQCSFTSTHSFSLKRHKQYKHEGVRLGACILEEIIFFTFP